MSQHPRGTNNKMADGNELVEEYSKRAKLAVSCFPFKAFRCYKFFLLLLFIDFIFIFFCQEDEIASLKRKIEALQNQYGSCSEPEAEETSDPELEKLLTENSKLKYRVETLKRVR